MVSDENEACNLLGWDVNDKLDLDEHLKDRLAIRDDLKASDLENEYMCHDLESSSKKYGKARYRVRSQYSKLLQVSVVLLIMSLF